MINRYKSNEQGRLVILVNFWREYITVFPRFCSPTNPRVGPLYAFVDDTELIFADVFWAEVGELNDGERGLDGEFDCPREDELVLRVT